MIDSNSDLIRASSLTRMIAVMDGDAPMSVPCVYDRLKNEYTVGQGVPKQIFEQKIGPCRTIDMRAMQHLQALAKPGIGLPSRTSYLLRSVDHLRKLGPTFQGVDLDRVAQARDLVPRQKENWSCGVNSGARFAAMMRQSIKHYRAYVDGAPRYGGIVGPNPEGLQNHLRHQSELAGTDIHQVCDRRFHGIWESLVCSVLGKGRPAMVLFMNSETSLHWVCILGRLRGSDNWFYMETDGSIWEIPGGDDELKQRMNMNNCWAQKLGFVERFNALVCTEECHDKDT